MWLRDAVQSNKLPTLKQLGNPRSSRTAWATPSGPTSAGAGVTTGGHAVPRGRAHGRRRGAIKKVLGAGREDLLEGVARRRAQDVRRLPRGAEGRRPLRAAADREEAGRRRAEPRPGAVARRQADRLPLREGPVLDRPVHGRRRHREGDPQAGLDRDRCALRQPAVHQVGGRLERGGPAFRPGRGAQRAEARSSSSTPRAGAGCTRSTSRTFGDREPGFTPDGRSDRVLGDAGRAARPVAVRPRDEAAPAADQRRVRRAAAGQVRPTARRSPSPPTASRRVSTTLDFGNYRIGLLGLASGKLREVPGYKDARNSNPQWSPDGKTVFFLSDIMGGTDVHRVDLASGELRQVTSLRTGVYGITPLSPSLSVAREAAASPTPSARTASTTSTRSTTR